MTHTQFVTDLEGPLTLNDNAFEIAAHFLPHGAHFFALISKYDDILADIVKRPGYRAGDTLKLIVPFLKAFGVCDRDLREFSHKTVKLVPRAREAIQRICVQMPTFIVSTSYEPYVQAVCEICDFPVENVYCTKISLDAYELSEHERRELLSLYDQIIQHPQMQIPSGVRSLDTLSARDRQTVEFFDNLFWGRLAAMEIGRLLQEMQPIGGPEKARALQEIVQRTGIALSHTIYVGDSITDVEALELVRREGGIALAFNGNRYALRAAEFGCISSSALALGEIAEAFVQGGREAVKALTLAAPPFLSPSPFPSPSEGRGERGVRVKGGGGEGLELTTHIDEAFIARSERMRRRLRGQEIGSLG